MNNYKQIASLKQLDIETIKVAEFDFTPPKASPLFFDPRPASYDQKMIGAWKSEFPCDYITIKEYLILPRDLKSGAKLLYDIAEDKIQNFPNHRLVKLDNANGDSGSITFTCCGVW